MSSVTDAKIAMEKAKAALDAALETERLDVLAKRIASTNAELVAAYGPRWTVEAKHLCADTVCIGGVFGVRWKTREYTKEVRCGPRNAHEEDCTYEYVKESETTVTVSVPTLRLQYEIPNGADTRIAVAFRKDHIAVAVEAFKGFCKRLNDIGFRTEIQNEGKI